MGESPIVVIVSERCSQSQCVAVMRDAKREGKVPVITGRVIMQTVTLSEFCCNVKKRSLNLREQKGSRALWA
jgi:hypothetical protein